MEKRGKATGFPWSYLVQDAIAALHVVVQFSAVGLDTPLALLLRRTDFRRLQRKEEKYAGGIDVSRLEKTSGLANGDTTLDGWHARHRSPAFGGPALSCC